MPSRPTRPQPRPRLAGPAAAPSWLKALGSAGPPATVRLRDGTYGLVEVLKHDFFAATALYDGPGGRVVVKFGRRQSLFGLPLGWVGRWLCEHERGAYRLLADVPGVPRVLEADAPDLLAHEYIPGGPLDPARPPPDTFFPALERLVAAIHARGMAYVDLEKRSNIIMDEQGRPWLVDFQISWCWPGRYWARTPPARWLLSQLQRGDRYHLLKHWRRLRPDQLTAEQLEASRRRPWAVGGHTRLTRPLTLLRRWLLRRLDPHRVRENERRGTGADGGARADAAAPPTPR